MGDFLLTDSDRIFRAELRDFLARQLTFTGDTIDARQALACGLVSRVVPADRLLDAARELAGRIAANPPQALRWTKRLIRESLEVSLPTALQMAATFQDMAHHTGDHREAIAALFEKRPPTSGHAE